MTSPPPGRRLLHRVPRPECGLHSTRPGPALGLGPAWAVPGRVTPGDGEKGRRSPCFPEPGAEACGRIAERPGSVPRSHSSSGASLPARTAW